MTPLAMEIVKQLTLPVRERDPEAAALARLMYGVHCFEISEVHQIIIDRMKCMSASECIVTKSTYLPAEKVFIEYRSIIKDSKDRCGMLLIRENDMALAVWCVKNDNNIRIADRAVMKLFSPENEGTLIFESRVDNHKLDALGFAKIALELINQPRILGARLHAPHRGLEKALLKQQKTIGKFPLHAWTEITLPVAPPQDRSGEASREARLTGRKALHFCRAHWSRRHGVWTLIKESWRGDASLGIRRSRYRLTA